MKEFSPEFVQVVGEPLPVEEDAVIRRDWRIRVSVTVLYASNVPSPSLTRQG